MGCSAFVFPFIEHNMLGYKQLSTALLNTCRNVEVNVDECLERVAWPPVKVAGCRNGISQTISESGYSVLLKECRNNYDDRS